jgi:4-amino-4-deoxy-L-arabinose transferase-like glycosyltransferase
MNMLSEAEQLAEDALPQVRAANWVFRVIFALAVAGAIGAAFWCPGQMAAKVGQAKVDASLGQATGDIATAAIPQINDATRQKVEVDVQVQKGQIDVRQAPDAGVAVHGVADALRRNLCLYDDLYRADPGCQPVHEDPDGVGPAGSNAGGTAHPD